MGWNGLSGSHTPAARPPRTNPWFGTSGLLYGSGHLSRIRKCGRGGSFGQIQAYQAMAASSATSMALPTME